MVWLTGPLLAPTPVNMERGHPALEPSLTLFYNYGEYDSNWKLKTENSYFSVNPMIDFQFAITEKVGAELLVGSMTSVKQGKTTSHLQDTLVQVGYQLLDNEIHGPLPNLRIDLQQIFPSGKYRNLEPSFEGVDSTGQGSYKTGLNLVVEKLFKLKNGFLSLEWSASYLIASPAYVKGYNAFGGGENQEGKVNVGNQLTAFFSGEYAFSKNVVFAFDTEFYYQSPSKYSQRTQNQSISKIPASFQLALAPAFEYNFSQNMGMLLGSWFTVCGKNSGAFTSIFGAFMYIF